LVRAYINHIDKPAFLPAFRVAHESAITRSNIQASFRGAGLVPFNPEVVLSRLDVKLRTPTPPIVEDTPWVSKTPSNQHELGAQSTLVRDRIQRHQNSSPIGTTTPFDQFVKGVYIMVHSAALLREENTQLRAANEALSARKSRKRKRIQEGGVLLKGTGADLAAQKRSGGQNKDKGAEGEVSDQCGFQARACRANGIERHQSSVESSQALNRASTKRLPCRTPPIEATNKPTRSHRTI